MFMRFVWSFGVGHTYSHSDGKDHDAYARRQPQLLALSSGKGDGELPSSSQNASESTPVTSITRDSTTIPPEPSPVTGTLRLPVRTVDMIDDAPGAEELSVELEDDDPTWALSDQEHDNDDVLYRSSSEPDSDLESIRSQASDDIPEDC
jgi:hypothetical protein